MRSFFPLLMMLFLSSFAGAQEREAPVQQQRLISSDERVVVIGQSSAACSAVLTQITTLRQELDKVIEDPDQAKGKNLFALNNDLVVTLYGQVGEPEPSNNYLIEPRKVESSKRLRIDLKIHLAKGLNRVQLRKSALECLLMDHCLNEELRDDQKIVVPPWLTTGVLERMAWRNDEADRGLYKSLFENGMMMDVEELITLEDPSELDAAERTTFRVSAGAILMAMLNQDGGKRTFLDYLSVVPTYEGESFLLFRNSFFTGGLSEKGLAKWWALQLAALTQEFVTETLTPLETEEALTEILRGNLEQEEGPDQAYRLIAFQDILALSEEERGVLLSPMLERVNLLRFRCFPSYRELLSGYARIIEQLAKGDEEGVGDLLLYLEEKRTILKQVGERTRDYLDWYQIANATSLTGEFADYQRLKKDLETQNPSHPGPIDHYLNAVQALYDE